MDLEKMFEKYEDEFLEFDRIENPPSKRPDLCAFLLLDGLVPGSVDMICAAEHDQFWLDVDCELLSKEAMEDDIVYLRRCGVRYDSETESLVMFT